MVRSQFYPAVIAGQGGFVASEHRQRDAAIIPGPYVRRIKRHSLVIVLQGLGEAALFAQRVGQAVIREGLTRSLQSGSHVLDHVNPVVGASLNEQTCTWVPRRIGPVSQPSPTMSVTIEYPNRFAKRAAKVRDRGIHGDDEIQTVDQRRRVVEVAQLIGPVVKQHAVWRLPRLTGRFTLLQRDEADARDRRQRRELLKRDRTPEVPDMPGGIIGARRSSPDEADLSTLQGGQPLFPGPRRFRISN